MREKQGKEKEEKEGKKRGLRLPLIARPEGLAVAQVAPGARPPPWPGVAASHPKEKRVGGVDGWR